MHQYKDLLVVVLTLLFEIVCLSFTLEKIYNGKN